ncbi:MAG TPA: ABC transporter substrate-binding protein [Pseudolabrys sp.]|nr:ABC transporter substrate-binding protein [Pseudolabrys sp.]
MRAKRTAWIICAGLILVIAAFRPAAADNAISFSLDRPVDGTAAPFLLPLDRGWYRAAGLDVTVTPADSMMEPILRVASGRSDMGLADINALIKYRDANPKAPVKAVFMLYNRPAYAVIGRKSRGISAPKDLEGKKLGASPDDPTTAEWPVFASVNKIDTAKVRIETVSKPVREPMLAAGQLDAIAGQSFSVYIDLKDKGVPVDDVVVLQMADYGVDLYGNAVIVNPKFAAQHPDAVKGFLRAFLKGLKKTVAAPQAAIGFVLERADGARKNLELERLKMVIRNNILTPEVKAEGYGGIDATRFEKAVDQLAIAYKFKSAKPKLQDIFDASFLPSQDERQLAAEK